MIKYIVCFNLTLLSILPISALMCQEVVFFSNGFLIREINAEEFNELSERMKFNKLEVIGGSARRVPGREDLQIVGINDALVREMGEILVSPESLVQEIHYGTCVVSSNRSKLIMVYRE